MTPKVKAEQARAEMLKTIRSLIRLKHSLAADRELNEVLPKADEAFTAMVHGSVLPSPADIRKKIGI